MSEFTKEEFEIIYQTLCGYVWQNPAQAIYLKPIINKIELKSSSGILNAQNNNDFTKEELIYLLDDLNIQIFEFGEDRINIMALQLQNKLESMVDSYCEHDSRIDIGEAPMICIKCEK